MFKALGIVGCKTGSGLARPKIALWLDYSTCCKDHVGFVDGLITFVNH